MSTFVKKATSAVAALAIVFSIVSPIAGVSAAFTSLEAANKLSTLGVIVDKSANPADYRLGDNLPRKEGVKVMMNLSSIAVVDNCAGKFSDLKSTDWACKYAETALANGMVAGNATFGPDRLLSKIEALKMVFQGRDLERNDNADWRVGYVEAAVENGVADAAFTDYDAAVTRGQFFIWAANAVDAEDVAGEDDLLCAILGTCEDDGDNTTGTGTTSTGTVVVTGGDLDVSLSPKTPVASTIPQGISGLAVATYDFTAGDNDVTVASLLVRRTGLSDKDTLGDIAVFTADGRVSKGKGDTQNNDTEATLTLSNGGVVVQAGETVTFTLVADVAIGTTADEFALELVEVVSTASDVAGLPVSGKLMKVGGVQAAKVTVQTDTTPSKVKAGDEGVDVAKFKIKGDDNRDVKLTSITLKENGTVDEEDELMNYELVYDGAVVATAKSALGKYVTFNLGAGVVIAEDQTEKFAVRADIITGASKNINFTFDKKLDLTGVDQQYGYGVSVLGEGADFGLVAIDAGEITLVDLDAASDKIRSDKQNVELGTIKVTNVSGGSLELQKFGVAAVSTEDNLGDILENFELEVNGTSYELSATTLELAGNNAVFKDSDIEVSIPQGTTTMVLRADTKANLKVGATVTLSLDTPTNDGADGVFYVVETEDDKVVNDLTPSSLTFKKLTVINAGASVSRVPLPATTTVVRGAKNVVALMFEVDADEASSIEVDEVKVLVESAASAATNTQISQVKLYKGSVSEANLLDGVSGSNLSGGVATLEGFNVTVAANAKQTFVVTLDVVDSAGIGMLEAYLYGVSMEDDDNDDIYLSQDTNTDGDIVDVADTDNVDGKGLDAVSNITVNNSGTIATLAMDIANEDNEFDKLALAGNSTVIASYDVRANNEEVDVETVVFTIAGGVNLGNSVTNASLLLDGKVVATNSNSDIGATTITFDDLSTLIIPTSTKEMALQLNTASIGKDKVGATQTALTVTNVVLSNAEGVESGKVLAALDIATLSGGASKTLDIVSAVVTPSIVSTFGNNDKTASLRLIVDGGSNTTLAGDSVQSELKTLRVEYSGDTLAGEVITVRNSNGTSIVNYTVLAGDDTNGYAYLVIADQDLVAPGVQGDSIGSNNEVYEITISGGTAIYKLSKAGVTYSTNNSVTTTTTKLENTLDFGEYSNN